MTSLASTSTSLINLLRTYRKLPYIVRKNHSHLYLLPQPPIKPPSYKIDYMHSIVQQQSQKYGQYYSVQNTWQNIQKKYRQKINQLESQKNQDIKEKKQLQMKIKFIEYKKKVQVYNEKYKQPIRLMNMSAFKLYLGKQTKKLRQMNKQNKNLKEIQDKQNQVKLIKKIYKISQNEENIKLTAAQRRIKALAKYPIKQMSKKWNQMSQKQKQIFHQQLYQLKYQNKQLIQKFIENHQIPTLKRYSVMSRFLSRYSNSQMNLTNPKTYQKYHSLPQQQKKQLSQESKRMNKESKQKFSIFLKNWNLTSDQLKIIIEVSLNYKKQLKMILKGYRKKKIQKNQEQDDDQEEDAISDLEYQINLKQDKKHTQL